MDVEHRADRSGSGRREAVLAGRVESGVEHGSVVLRAAGRTWQLGPRWGHLAGRDVVVRGTPVPDLLTTAQQGMPLTVAAVTTPDGDPLDPLDGTAAGDRRGV